MTGFLKSGSDRALLIKSVLVACAVAALLLGGLRHAAPAAPADSSYGGRVLVLLPSRNEDRAAFARWRQLNLPANIFGYDSPGPFAALFPRRNRESAPPVFSARPASVFTPDLTVPAYPVPRTEFPGVAEVPLPLLAGSAPEQLPLAAGAVVCDETGKVRLRLPGLQGNTPRGPLMLRAADGLAGTEFRIVGSSGSGEFDRSVLENLERRVRQAVEYVENRPSGIAEDNFRAGLGNGIHQRLGAANWHVQSFHAAYYTTWRLKVKGER